MRKYFVLAVVFVCSWLSVAQAQVGVEPNARKDEIFVGENNRGDPQRKLYNLSYSRNLNSHIGREGTINSKRYLERFNNEGGNSGSTPSTGPVYNPYTIHWR